MFAFPNPYAHIDHKGRLAGLCPVGQPLYAAGKLPKREYVGASIDREHAERTYDPGDEGQGISPMSDVRFVFEPAAVLIEERADLGMHYKHAFDSACLIQVAKAEDVPLDALAKARTKAIADWRANYGDAPSDVEWLSQFALDEQVKARGAPPAPSTAAPAAPAVTKPPAQAPKES